jgi:fructose PTS system EIIBC or EIIC component
MKISEILTEDLINIHLSGEDKNSVINEMIDLISKSSKVVDIEKIRSAIFEREKIMTTGVGNGFAIPHGKTDAISDIIAAFGITDKPINYQALDEKPVRILFLLVGKESMVGPHIKLLSRISRLMSKEEFRQKLLNLKSVGEVIEAIKNEEAAYFDI